MGYQNVANKISTKDYKSFTHNSTYQDLRLDVYNSIIWFQHEELYWQVHNHIYDFCSVHTGFDPWNESSKGLADLLEKELQLGTPATTASNVQVTQPPPGFNPSPFNHTGFGIRPPAQPLPTGG